MKRWKTFRVALAVVVAAVGLWAVRPAISQWAAITTNAITQADSTKAITLDGGTKGITYGSGGSTFAKIKLYHESVAVSSTVAANTTAAQTLTVTGVAVGDTCVGVVKPTEQAGLGIVGCRVSATAANSIVLTFSNNTGAVITPTTPQAYKFFVLTDGS